jgi:myosin heavy subunit
MEIQLNELPVGDKYPWMYLFDDEALKSDLPADVEELENQVDQTQAEKEMLAKSLDQQKQLVEQQAAHLDTQHKKLSEMKEVSTSTFDKLTSQNKRLEDEKAELQAEHREMCEKFALHIKQLQDENVAMQEKQSENAFSELIYPIIVQSIISHKAGFKGEAKRKKTQNGVLRWLHQRRNVIVYLKSHNLHEDVIDELENILFIDEEALRGLLAKLEV